MPRATRATTRRTAQSTAPYPTRTVSTSSQNANLAVVAPPPVMSWDHMAQTPYYLDAQMQGQLDEYNQHVLASYHTGLPTPISGAGPVRPLSAPLQMSHNTFFGVPTSGARESSSWSDRMDEILIENAGRKKWDQISKQYFNGVKSANACRKRHGRIKEERKDPSKWPVEERERIIDAYRDEASRERMWTPLAEEVGKPWRDVEQLIISQTLRQITGRATHGNRRRASQAASHRSHPSIGSSTGQNIGYSVEQDDEEDSGLGSDVQTHHTLMPMPSHEFAQRESYEPMPNFDPENYYRAYDR